MRRFFSLLLFWLIAACVGSAAADPVICSPATPALSAAQQASCAIMPLSHWATMLGWTPAASATNLCNGYYAEPALISAYPHPAPINETQMVLTSKGPSLYSLTDVSTLEGSVVLSQPGREIKAEKATLIRNKTTGEVDQIDLQGDVHFQEAGKLIVGNSSHIDLTQKTITIDQGAYHIARPATHGPVDAWGTAEQAQRQASGLIWLQQATYTTCAPADRQWYIKAKSLALNQDTGRGTAKNAWLYAGKVPFFYTPYLNFPIDKRRYSGFLYPSLGYDNQSGAVLSVPYYFNLAPNYDDTLTATPLSNRGLLSTNLFRYLTHSSEGSVQLGFLPGDRVFESFKRTASQQFPPSATNTPFLNNIANSSASRSAIAVHDSTLFNPAWSGLVDVNYVSDAYYFQDLGGDAAAINADQLLNRAQTDYHGEHWQFSAAVEAWQTLHQINQDFVLDQYQRLPQLNLNASYPDQAHGLDYEFNSESTLFEHADDFFTSAPYPTGNRTHLNPQVSLPWRSSAGYLIPTLGLDATGYSVANNGVVNMNVSPPVVIPASEPDLNTVRTLPIFDIDSGLYFDRDIQLAAHPYHQTLEPRIFYLFVPQSNQNNIPIFDTTLPPFSFDELYRTNRFMGYDRLGDANQLSLGLISRILDSFSGEDKLDMSVGGIYYFHQHTVCLYPDCSDDPTLNDRVSPIAAQIAYHLSHALSLTASIAWDPNQSQVNNDSLRLQYTRGPGRVLSLGYDYVENGDVLNASDPDSSANSLHRIDLALTWPLSSHWSAVGDWNYNISHGHPQTYLYGLEYDSCCWAVRLVASRTLQAEDVGGTTSFRSGYYVQFLLKGLGVVGNAAADSLLRTSVPGYVDPFKG